MKLGIQSLLSLNQRLVKDESGQMSGGPSKCSHLKGSKLDQGDSWV